ncbi:MAG TPA: serine/threonine-protein kinase [Kofleriaceae bacterium]|nr:serine/threonine-protein kinase [Kofleriaceae bacterium]
MNRRAPGDTQRIARAPAERELIAGRYEILSLLGSGGMAEVFSGRDRMLERMVAIKRPRRDTGAGAEISERLQREAMALASIDSPNVVAIHDVGATQHGVYLVMQRLFGPTLDEDIGAHGPVSAARACQIARDILDGLAAIHASGLVHRDLKASNVLLSRGDRAVLLDLGAALHLRRRSLTAPGTLLGTPECMAPEQLAQGPLDGRADLFQLGLILIYLVTGTMAESTVDPTQLAIPPALSEVIARALAPVGARYASAGEMRGALDQALAACTLDPIEPVFPDRPTLRWPESTPRP